MDVEHALCGHEHTPATVAEDEILVDSGNEHTPAIITTVTTASVNRGAKSQSLNRGAKSSNKQSFHGS